MAVENKIKKFAFHPFFTEFYMNSANQDRLCWEEAKENIECVTANVELDEFIKTLSREKKDYSYTAKSAKKVFHAKETNILRPTLHDELNAIDCFLQFENHNITFNESVSRVIKANHNIQHHFPMSCIKTEYILPHEWRKKRNTQSQTSQKDRKHLTDFFKNVNVKTTPSSAPKLFIDTSAFVATFFKKEDNHDTAMLLWDTIGSNRNIQCYTSNFVLGELFTLLAWRVDYAYASQQAIKFLESNPFTILRPDREIELAALNDFEKYTCLKISYTDCLSFALMRKHNIREAFAFDNDFVNPGKFSLFHRNTIHPYSS